MLNGTIVTLSAVTIETIRVHNYRTYLFYTHVWKILFTLLSIHFLIFFIQIPWNVSTVIVFGICFYSSSTKFCTMEIGNMINTATTSMKKKVNTSYYMQMNIFLLQNLWILKCFRTLSWRAKEIPWSHKNSKMRHIIYDILEINWYALNW